MAMGNRNWELGNRRWGNSRWDIVFCRFAALPRYRLTALPPSYGYNDFSMVFA
ncbi:hypothetical protein BH20CHL4_BH20CHL4_13960 [soil metagenome]